MCFWFKKKKAQKVETKVEDKKEVKEEAKPVVEEKKEVKKAVKKTTAKKETKAVADDEKAIDIKSADGTKVYHVSKRKSDDKWTVKFAGGSKVIKLFDTKKAALAYTEVVAKNQEGVILTHASKGKKAGKIYKKHSVKEAK